HSSLSRLLCERYHKLPDAIFTRSPLVKKMASRGPNGGHGTAADQSGDHAGRAAVTAWAAWTEPAGRVATAGRTPVTHLAATETTAAKRRATAERTPPATTARTETPAARAATARSAPATRVAAAEPPGVWTARATGWARAGSQPADPAGPEGEAAAGTEGRAGRGAWADGAGVRSVRAGVRAAGSVRADARAAGRRA